VVPEKVVSPLEGIREAFPDAEISYSLGAVVQTGVVELPLAELVNPGTGEPGVLTRFIDENGIELHTENRRSTALVWLGSEAPVDRTEVLELSTTWTPTETGRVRFGVSMVGYAAVMVDGEILLEAGIPLEGNDPGAVLFSAGTRSHSLEVVAGTPVDIVIEYRRQLGTGMDSLMAFSFGTEAPDVAADTLIDEAAAAAAAADLVVLVVGTTASVESEGFDRENLDLPGDQDELARRVLAANPRTVVVVNSGSPVILPWRDDAAAILLAWFGGQEMGHALGDILTGDVEPGGRMPTTWPSAQSDVPVINVTPVDGEVRYDEGIHIGYRAWLKSGIAPAFPFGFGLGYTTWSFDSARSTLDSVEVVVTNTGTRRGKQVVQVYASRADSAVDRPVRWLVGFAVVEADASESVTVSIAIPERSFAHWDNGWQYEVGDFTLRIGANVHDLPLELTTRVK
jgi:beta-glucosidase